MSKEEKEIRMLKTTLITIWDEASNLEPHLVKMIEKSIPKHFMEKK